MVHCVGNAIGLGDQPGNRCGVLDSDPRRLHDFLNVLGRIYNGGKSRNPPVLIGAEWGKIMMEMSRRDGGVERVLPGHL